MAQQVFIGLRLAQVRRGAKRNRAAPVCRGDYFVRQPLTEDREVQRAGATGHLSRFDATEQQHLFHHARHVTRGVGDVPDIGLALLWRKAFEVCIEDFRRTRDDAERRAEFVRDHRYEPAFQFAQLFFLRERPLDFRFGAFAHSHFLLQLLVGAAQIRGAIGDAAFQAVHLPALKQYPPDGNDGDGRGGERWFPDLRARPKRRCRGCDDVGGRTQQQLKGWAALELATFGFADTRDAHKGVGFQVPIGRRLTVPTGLEDGFAGLKRERLVTARCVHPTSMVQQPCFK